MLDEARGDDVAADDVELQEVKIDIDIDNENDDDDDDDAERKEKPEEQQPAIERVATRGVAGLEADFREGLVRGLARDMARLADGEDGGVGRAADRARAFLDWWEEGDVKATASEAGRWYFTDGLHAAVRGVRWPASKVWLPVEAAGSVVGKLMAERSCCGFVGYLLWTLLVFLPILVMNIALALAFQLAGIALATALVLPLYPLCVLLDRVVHGAPVYEANLTLAKTPTATRLHRDELFRVWGLAVVFLGAAALALVNDDLSRGNAYVTAGVLVGVYAINVNLFLASTEIARKAQAQKREGADESGGGGADDDDGSAAGGSAAADEDGSAAASNDISDAGSESSHAGTDDGAVPADAARPVSVWRVLADLGESARGSDAAEGRGVLKSISLATANALLSIVGVIFSLWLSGDLIAKAVTTNGRGNGVYSLLVAGAAFIDLTSVVAVVWLEAKDTITVYTSSSESAELLLILATLLGLYIVALFLYYVEPTDPERGLEVGGSSNPAFEGLVKAAVDRDDTAAVSRLLDYCGAEEIGRKAWVAAHHAAWKGHVATLTLLLDRGADVNSSPTGWFGRTLLHAAAAAAKLDAVRFLLERGADASVRDKNGKTAGERVLKWNGSSSDRKAVCSLLGVSGSGTGPSRRVLIGCAALFVVAYAVFALLVF